MRTILSIVRSELKQRLFSWYSVLFFFMLVFQAIWYTQGTFDYYINDQVLMNAPSIMYRNYASMGMLMIIIVAIAAVGVLYRDIQYKSAQWTYALPIKDKHFFLGRFLAAYLYLIIISTGMVVGHILLPYSGIGEAENFGPTPWGQLVHGWLIFTVPNLLVYVGLVFFAIIFTRRRATGYLAVFGLVIAFMIMQASYDTGGGDNVFAYILADPSGYLAAQHYTDLQSPLEKNTDYFHLSSFLLHNRLVWFGISLLLTLAAYFKFSFKYFIQAGRGKSKKDNSPRTDEPVIRVELPSVKRYFRTSDHLKKLWSLSKLEFFNIVRPTSFKIILGIIFLMVFLQNVTWNAAYYIGKEVPITSNMTFFRLQWGIFVNVLIMIWAGELFFKDRTTNIWQVADSLPVPVWVTQLSRFVAIIGLSFVLSLSFVAISIFTQILLGGAAYIDPGRFAEDLLLHRWAFLTFVLYAALVFFVASLTSKRVLTHLISVGFFLFLIISFDMGIVEDLRIGFGLIPGVEDYSETSGYGIFQQSANWFFFLWTSLAISMIMIGIWLWKRGADKKWFNRLSLRNRQLSHVSKFAMLSCFAVFLFLMSFIGKSVYDSGNFTPKAEEEFLSAEYEKKYKYLETRSHPRYAAVNLELDLFPSQRRAEYKGAVTLANDAYTDTLMLNWQDFITVNSLRLDGEELKKVKEDPEHNLTAFLIPPQYRSDSLLNLSVEAVKQYEGFTQSDFQADLTYVGSFGSVHDFLPFIGYQGDNELTENRKRAAHGLPKLNSRMAPVDDPQGLRQNVFSTDAGRVTGRIVIGTEEGQLPFAGGQLIKLESRSNRLVAHYQIGEPGAFNWHFGSSEYEKMESQAHGIRYRILHKPFHTFNLMLYDDALQKGIAFLQSQFGPGAVMDQLQLVEIHRWQDPIYAFANTIAISEKEGWVAETDGLKEKAYIYQTVGSGLAQLWIQQHLQVANVQGADMLTKALPEAMGLQFVKETFGTEAVELLIQKKVDKYAKDRNNEPNTEPALLYADGTGYLEENRGAVVLYEAIEEMGREQFGRTFTAWAAKERDYSTFKGLLTALKGDLSAEMVEKFTVIN